MLNGNLQMSGSTKLSDTPSLPVTRYPLFKVFAVASHLSFLMHRKQRHLRLADRPADYNRLGISPVAVAEFEDGQRIGMEKGRYEWWYFDAHLDDGATVVVVFYTKPNVSPNGPLAPRITINLTLPDGRSFVKFLDAKAELFSASKSGCDVRIGANRFAGDLNRYHIATTIEEITVDIELTGDVPAWRPKSGHLYFGTEGREKLFAWLPAVPHGLASVRYTIGAEEHRASGSGYHDHNWGDVPMRTLMHNWYWARGSVGPYTVIASYITATEAYGYDTQIVYMLAKDGRIIADDDTRMVSWLVLLSCRACAAACWRVGAAGPNRNRFDPTAEVEGRQHQMVLSMAATMRWVRPRAKGIARQAVLAAIGQPMAKADHHRITKSFRQPISKNVNAPLTTETMMAVITTGKTNLALPSMLLSEPLR